MRTRIVIPTIEDKGLSNRISEHFGRAPYFTIVDLGEDGDIVEVKSIENTGEHFGGRGRAKDIIIGVNPTAVIVYELGPRALEGFQEAGIPVLKANQELVQDIISAYRENKLEELTSGCQHSRHRGDIHI